jgi:hypothetical protein
VMLCSWVIRDLLLSSVKYASNQSFHVAVAGSLLSRAGETCMRITTNPKKNPLRAHFNITTPKSSPMSSCGPCNKTHHDPPHASIDNVRYLHLFPRPHPVPGSCAPRLCLRLYNWRCTDPGCNQPNETMGEGSVLGGRSASGVGRS